MPYGRMGERLGLPASALQIAATAQASQAVASGVVATQATTNIIDSWGQANRRYLIRTTFMPLGTAATGNATVAVYHGTATGAMSAASVGTGTTPMQATVAVGSAGKILDLEVQGADLVGKNRYLQAIVTPGGSLAATIVTQIITEARYLSPSANNVSALATPVVVADL